MNLAKTLLPLASIQHWVELLQKKKHLFIDDLFDAPKAVLIAALAEKKIPVLYICPSVAETHLLENLESFGIHALEMPSWETLPGEEIRPSPDLIGRRLDILRTMQQESHVVLCSLQAALQKVPHSSNFNTSCEIHSGQEIAFGTFIDTLKKLYYTQVPLTSDKGQFSVRGGIIDVFPISSLFPLRIDFFGDTLEKIRSFDAASQKSTGTLEKALILPASESALLKLGKEQSLLDCLPKNAVVIFDDPLELENRYVSLKNLPGAEDLVSLKDITSQALQKTLALFPVESLYKLFPVRKIGTTTFDVELFDTPCQLEKMTSPFLALSSIYDTDNLLHELVSDTTRQVHFVFSSAKEQEHILEAPHSLEGYLTSGFVLAQEALTIAPYTEFSKKRKITREQWRTSYAAAQAEEHELTVGEIVVHTQQGIGRFTGIEKKPNHLGEICEYLVLEYAEKSRYFVPIALAHQVSRYVSTQELPPTFNTLGTTKWQKTLEKACTAIAGYAEELLKQEAERAFRGGFSFGPDSDTMQAFEEEFPYQETKDQLRATGEIKHDMMSSEAMDRLVCGDVGFGKTEVAMRAAFKAVIDGKKQVAVLVPTTVLAMQHYENFCLRMENFPVKIGIASRFQTAKQVKKTLESLFYGEIDIIIGTHRLISQDVIFKDLGLIIIDEEQRFGVRAKEHLKKFKVGVDCLTLSATPIPRTLYMTLVGAREVSVISTPPHDRLPIKTVITPKNEQLIKTALIREIARGGQAFYIHNRVETIFSEAHKLQEMIPELKIGVAHGQMAADEIDEVFHNFKTGKIDLLVATTIIENGIDIPNANTIVIDKADTFGIADLYQMRGRVGRWNKAAYAYFLTSPSRPMTELSRKRLFALAESSSFGGGMKVAMRDLEIRGAGDMLGQRQSGHVASIGFQLYCKMLKKAVAALKKGKPLKLEQTKLEFTIPANIPDVYINDANLRLEIYSRLGEAEDELHVDSIAAELVDRYGKMPLETRWLYHLTRLRIFADRYNFTLIKIEKHSLYAERKQGKTELKRTLLLPFNRQKPDSFEEEAKKSLKESFFI